MAPGCSNQIFAVVLNTCLYVWLLTFTFLKVCQFKEVAAVATRVSERVSQYLILMLFFLANVLSCSKIGIKAEEICSVIIITIR